MKDPAIENLKNGIEAFIPNKDISVEENISKLAKLHDFISTLPGALVGDSPEYLEVCPIKHTFVDGAYVREIFLPKGMSFVTKIHAKTHPYFIMKGSVSVYINGKTVRLDAPHSGITKAGTQRFLCTHEDTIWITVHVTNKTDVEEIKKDVTVNNLEELKALKLSDKIKGGLS